MLDRGQHSASGDDASPAVGSRDARILLLWDVDHTLIDNGGVSKEIYAGAFSLLAGRPAEHPPRTNGRTDTEIMRGMLAAHGLQDVPLSLARLGEALTQAAADRADALRERGHALPGALVVLTTLHDDHPDVIQSVLTGNVQPVALVKLGAFGLDRYLDFEVGGFGSDSAVRSDLVGVAQRKAAHKYGIEFDRSTTVLVGDTPRDVQAGRQGGAYVLAVASGASSPEELSAEGADAVLPDLRETRTVINAILAVRCNRGIGSQG
jgi:phosphoglycolate phosphatase-like HAD superfamily hydrolase